ncbi:MAG: hypothetical protein O7G85_12370 [Planctomycetota bacterium]|nr:hypothetical protein [Planctomycetota bacterium]
MKNSRLRHVIVMVVVCGLSEWCFAGLIETEQQTPLANDPVSLELDASSLVDEANQPTETQSEKADLAEADPESVPTNQLDIEQEDQKSIETTSLGDRPLGLPEKLFTLGETDTRETSESGFWSTFDPRTNDLSRTLGAMAVVIGLILLLRVVLQRLNPNARGGMSPSGVLQILARYPIAKGQQLILLKLGRRIVLTHQSATGMATLTEITDPEELGSLLTMIEAGSRKTKHAKSFQLMLRGFESQHDASRSAGQTQGEHDGQLRANEGDIIDLTKRSSRFTPALKLSTRSHAS